MTEAITVTRFQRGDPIPEWLIALTPASPEARKENFRFALDVLVVDMPDRYMIVAANLGQPGNMFDASGTQGCIAHAASKPVCAVGLQEIWFESEAARMATFGPRTLAPDAQLGWATHATAVEPIKPREPWLKRVVRAMFNL